MRPLHRSGTRFGDSDNSQLQSRLQQLQLLKNLGNERILVERRTRRTAP